LLCNIIWRTLPTLNLTLTITRGEYRIGYDVMMDPFLQGAICRTGTRSLCDRKSNYRGYGCSGGDDLSEASILFFLTHLTIVHWPPFLKAAVEYIQDTYPNPENDDKAQALIAFIFAVSGHQVQDAAWHSIGLLMGFIDEVAKVDCQNNYRAAHEILDWGGDAIFSTRFKAQKGSGDWVYVYCFCCCLMVGRLVCSHFRSHRNLQTT
jgi:Zinc dependent phospholipase C